MKDHRTPNETQQRSRNASAEKKLYQKPAFRYERVFETRALSCGKIIATQGNCQFSMKTS
jgi:hypothetical protein